jgi:phosphomevalonate kinase
MSSSTVAVSAPGKVLFAGGFLVLDRRHTGLIFGLNARIHIIIQPYDEPPRAQNVQNVLVESPQFQDARWLYGVSTAPDGADGQGHYAAINCHQVIELKDGGITTSSNKFVETTLRYVLTYIRRTRYNAFMSMQASNMKISIMADDDYYSQAHDDAKTAVQAATNARNGFSSFGVKLSDAHKTGLGSSAALVTSLVAALLSYFCGTTSLDERTIHNLAQASHCAAQGKVGSGFDVAAAVYGSCLYRRFTATILESVGEPSSSDFAERLQLCIDDLNLASKWDVEVAKQAVQIPESLLLVMCDVDCGSETPGMVRKVLSWRKEKPQEAALLWNALQQGQEELCQELRKLTTIKDVDHDFTALGDIIATIRSLVREMSTKSEVPIEPPVITELLDFCTSLSGVVGGVAPGAGGYDAIVLLLRNDPKVVLELQGKLVGWKGSDKSGATIGNVRLLGVKQEYAGVRMESIDGYNEWL